MSGYDKNFSRLNNGVLFLDGNNTYGKVEEVNNPEIKAKMTDHKVLGMNGTLELPSGLDKMEASFKLNGPLDEVSAISADVKTSHDFMFRGSLESYKGQSVVAQRPYVCSWKGTFKNSPGGNQKQHENPELNYSVNVTYYKLTIDGVVMVEIDIINNIHKVKGVDQLAQYKQNLGL
jgi:P2 family phage contractile tail tube protein